MKEKNIWKTALFPLLNIPYSVPYYRFTEFVYRSMEIGDI